MEGEGVGHCGSGYSWESIQRGSYHLTSKGSAGEIRLRTADPLVWEWRTVRSRRDSSKTKIEGRK